MEPHLVPISAETGAETELLQCGYRYALSLTHRQHDAEDLLQEAWVNLCRHYGEIGSRARLFTAIRNLFIDRCRRERVVAFEPLDDAAELPGAAAEIQPGTGDDLEVLLGQLSAGEREAVYLHHIEGHTAGEISTLTRQPRNTVLSLLHRALKKLRKAVSDPGCPLQTSPIPTAISRPADSSPSRKHHG